MKKRKKPITAERFSKTLAAALPEKRRGILVVNVETSMDDVDESCAAVLKALDQGDPRDEVERLLGVLVDDAFRLGMASACAAKEHEDSVPGVPGPPLDPAVSAMVAELEKAPRGTRAVAIEKIGPHYKRQPESAMRALRRRRAREKKPK